MSHRKEIYDGTKLEGPISFKYKKEKQKEQKIHLDAYIPNDDLIEAVQLTMRLQKRPLLLMGEPGSGKTRLAEAVAYELYGKKYLDYYFEWFIKSTTRAQEGFYRYDALRRLNDAQILKNDEREALTDRLRLDEKNSYFKRGVIAEAFAKSTGDEPSIILIDEIDKASIDFPNDLLRELEKFEFTIPETGDKIEKPENFTPPIIFITSNQERELPPAFLRRCIYFYIDFPDEENLIKILKAQFQRNDHEYIEPAIKTFMNIRQRIKARMAGVEKKVSTSELIDWFKMITDILRDEHSENQKLYDKIQEWLNTNPEDVKEGKIKIPFYQLLLKNIETRELFRDHLLNEANQNKSDAS